MIRIIILLLLICSQAFADDTVNTGGTLNRPARVLGAFTNGDCLAANASGLVVDAGTGACGSGSGSSFWVAGNVGINTTSNVGIGSTNPGQKLDVQGTVRALGTDFGNIIILHGDGTTTGYKPTANTDTARGTALLNAAAALVDKDTLILPQGTFDIQANGIDLSKGQTISASMRGDGKYITTIKSSFDASAANNFIVSPGLVNSEVKDLSIKGTLSGHLQYPFGGLSYFTNALLENVYISNASDGIVVEDFNGASNFTMRVFNLTTDTNFDSINVQSGTLEVYDSILRQTTGGGYGATCRGIVNSELGTVGTTILSFNTTISSTGCSVQNAGYVMTVSGGGVTEVWGGKITVTGTGAKDIYNSVNATITINPADTNYSPQNTTGNILYTKHYGKSDMNYVNGTGTMDSSDGSGNVTGIGTLFTKELMIGTRVFLPGEGTICRVNSITNDTTVNCFPDPGASGDTFQYINPLFYTESQENNPNTGTVIPGKMSIDSSNNILMKDYTNPDNFSPMEIHITVPSGSSWVPLKLVNDSNYVSGIALDTNKGLNPEWLFYRYGSNPSAGGYPLNRFCIGVNGSFEAPCIDSTTRGMAIGSSYASNANPYSFPTDGMIIQGNVGIGTNFPGSQFEVGARKFDVTSGGNIGVNSVSPGQKFDVQGTIRIFNHLISKGTAPTVANNDCGTTVQGTVTAGSTDFKGSFTVGTLAVTSCSITFANAFNTTPICITQDDTNVLATKSTATTTKLTTVGSVSLSGDVVSYYCIE